MLHRGLLLLSLSCTLSLACGAEGDPEVDQGAQPVAAQAGFVGLWEETPPEPGYETFLVIEESGQGYLCCADGKSQASFTVTIEGDKAVMGSYGYGGGDELTVEGDKLTRVGEDKGEIYTSEHKRVAQLPDFCQEQIDDMKE